jgi:hypothetical protein
MEKARSLLQSYGLRRDNQSVSADNSVLCLICWLSRFCFVLFLVERWGQLVKKWEEGALCAEKKIAVVRGLNEAKPVLWN